MAVLFPYCQLKVGVEGMEGKRVMRGAGAQHTQAVLLPQTVNLDYDVAHSLKSRKLKAESRNAHMFPLVRLIMVVMIAILRSKWLALQFSSFFAYSAPLRGYSIVFYPAALVVSIRPLNSPINYTIQLAAVIPLVPAERSAP